MSLVACLHAVSFGTFIKTSLINKQTKRNTCFTQYVTHKAFVLGSRTYKKTRSHVAEIQGDVAYPF